MLNQEEMEVGLPGAVGSTRNLDEKLGQAVKHVQQ